MKKILEYKGYHAKIEFDYDDMILYGKIEGISDLVTFENVDASKIEQEFHLAVDDYLDFCKEVNKKPEKEYKGQFNVRINPELHKKLAVISLKNGDSINASVEKAISEYVSDSKQNVTEEIKIIAKYLKNSSMYTSKQSINVNSTGFIKNYIYGGVTH